MSIGIVISLLGGLAFFLFGMRTMGEGLERAAGPKLKHFLTMMTRNRVIAMLTGICVTALQTVSIHEPRRARPTSSSFPSRRNLFAIRQHSVRIMVEA